MKLIHSGKVLKDDDTIESCNIKPNAFLVVMISKVRIIINAHGYIIIIIMLVDDLMNIMINILFFLFQLI